MASRREAFLAGVLALLNTGRPDGMPLTWRERAKPFNSKTAGYAEMNLVFPAFDGRMQETIRPITGQNARGRTVVGRELVFGVEVYRAGTSEEALDAYLCWITKALAGQAVAGSNRIEEKGTIWQGEVLDLEYRKAMRVLQATVPTRQADEETGI